MLVIDQRLSLIQRTMANELYRDIICSKEICAGYLLSPTGVVYNYALAMLVNQYHVPLRVMMPAL